MGRRRAELAACLAVTAAIVVLRSIPSVWHEQIFDSDQAIVGLMAKHLSEFRWFPLFFYGQNYMLGVQAWMAAPCFWIGGPTIAMLRAPLLLLNVAVPVLLMIAMMRRGLRPLAAFVASLPLIATGPVVSVDLLKTLGASIEPFVYVLGLWAIRTRPAAFGLLACFGTLHREFTIFALPALAVAGHREWRAWGLRGFARAAAAASGLWITVDLLKRQIDTFGPGSPAHETGSLSLQAATIAQWISFDAPRYAGCLRDAVVTGLRELVGALPGPLTDHAISSSLGQGSTAAGLVLAGALLVCATRSVVAWRRAGNSPGRDQRVFLYLGIVAVCPLLAYGLNGGIQPGDPVVLRYLLLSLLLPVAVIGGFYVRETRRTWQLAVGVLVIAWAAANVRDTARFAYEYTTAPPPSPHRVMADYLTANGVGYGSATYWDAYRITFLARERVILSSQDVVRIASYQSRVAAQGDRAVTLVREPCHEGLHVSEWCIVGGPPALGAR